MSLAQSFPVLGVVGYNGASFGPSVNCTATATPQYDSAQRTIIYYVVSFHFEWYVDMANNNQSEPDVNNRATTTDSQLETLRQQLMHNGADFQYAGNGFGYLDVNTAPTSPPVIEGPSLLDCVWGPKPRKFTFETFAGKAAKCSFDIDVALLNCPDVLASGKLMEFCFKVSWDVEDGITRRTYSAHLSIPATRGSGGSRKLPDNADKYLGLAVPDVPAGFRRKPVSRTLSEDKCRLDVTVVDEQWPGRNYPPKSVISVQAKHTVSSPDAALAQWTGQFSGTYEYARTVSPALAYKEFLAWVKDRLDNVKTASGFTPILQGLTLTEPDAYGRGMAEFQLNYRYALSKELKDIAKQVLSATGLWRPVPGSDYISWAKSMKDLKVWDPRGYAQLAFKDSDDLIIDLCLEATTPVIPKETPPLPKEPAPPKPPDLPLFIPKPGDSFIDYRLDLMIRPIHATAELKPLPTKPVFYQGKKGVAVDATDGYQSPCSVSNPSVIQMRNIPSYVVTLRGRALRAGYSITPLQITSIAGQTAVPKAGAGDFFTTGVAANWLGVPIIRALWQFSYILPDNPTQGIGAPDNPLLGKPTTGPTLEFFTGK